jgi:hypothetical protein
MHPKTIDEQIEAEKEVVALREREVKAAQSYLDQARSRLSDLESEKEYARIRALEATVRPLRN